MLVRPFPIRLVGEREVIGRRKLPGAALAKQEFQPPFPPIIFSHIQ